MLFSIWSFQSRFANASMFDNNELTWEHNTFYPVAMLASCTIAAMPFYFSTLAETFPSPDIPTRWSFSTASLDSQYRDLNFEILLSPLSCKFHPKHSWRWSRRAMWHEAWLESEAGSQAPCWWFLPILKESKREASRNVKIEIKTFTWKVICDEKINLSHSNNPLVVYWKTENVMQSISLLTRSITVSSPLNSALKIAFWKTTLKAFSENW